MESLGTLGPTLNSVLTSVTSLKGGPVMNHLGTPTPETSFRDSPFKNHLGTLIPVGILGS